MHQTKNDLPTPTRKKMIDLLNARLADMIDLKLQSKQAHWNVKGPTFIALHELFDEIAKEVEGYSDELAERVLQLGGSAEGTLTQISKKTTLPAYPPTIASGRDHVQALSTAIATVAKATRAAIEESAKAGDAVTSDILTGMGGGLDLKLWFVEAHLQAEN